MSLYRPICLMWLMVAVAPALHAEDANKPATEPEVDEEFLEFLGSVDADDADEDWIEYLARTDIVKVAKAKKQTPATTEDKK